MTLIGYETSYTNLTSIDINLSQRHRVIVIFQRETVDS